MFNFLLCSVRSACFVCFALLDWFALLGLLALLCLACLVCLVCLLCLICLVCLTCLINVACVICLAYVICLASLLRLACCVFARLDLARKASLLGYSRFLATLSKFYRKTAITCSKSEVEDDFSKTHVPAVILIFFCQRPNFARNLNP